jgi:hypothetical protein
MNDDPRSGLTQLIQELESNAYKNGAREARERFGKTIRDAIGLLISLLESGASAIPECAIRSKGVSKKSRFGEPRAGSSQMKVLSVVRTFPSCRPTDIVNHLQNDLNGPSVRTALNRLKSRGAIVQKQGSWFAVGEDSRSVVIPD